MKMSTTPLEAKLGEMEFVDEDILSDEEPHYEESGSSEDIQEEVFRDELQISTRQVEFTQDELIELGILREEEIDRMIDERLIKEDDRFDESLREKLVFKYPEMILTLQTGERYPVFPLSYTIDNLTLPRLVVDGLRIALREIMVKFDDKNAIQRWLTRADNENYGAFESDMVALQLAKETKEHIISHRTGVKEKVKIKRLDPDDPVSVSEESASRDQVLASESGVDLLSYNTAEAVKDLLGKSIPEVCESIPSRYRILHVENVVKASLYAEFYKVKKNIRDRLLSMRTTQLRSSVPPDQQRKSNAHGALAERREREALADYLVQPKCTFHGTQRHAVANIVRHGFLRPGDINPDTGMALEVRCGNTYGRGIYTSPSAEFSLSYSGYEAAPTEASQFSGLKLIVCATIMGRPAQVTREDNWRNQNEPYKNADSHVGNQEFEYIVFQPRQTIPVLVIHLDWGKEHYFEFAHIPNDPASWIQRMREKRKEGRTHWKLQQPETLFPADIVRRKQALMARALKWFPYGYGPATGTRFVIEAVGDVSDDEEDYGEYQKDKVEGEAAKDGSAGYFWEAQELDDEDSRFDEFFMERRVKAGRIKTVEAGPQEED